MMRHLSLMMFTLICSSLAPGTLMASLPQPVLRMEPGAGLHAGAILDIAAAAGIVATLGQDGTVHLHGSGGRKPVGTLRLPASAAAGRGRLSLSADGRLLAVATAAPTVFVFDVRSRRTLARITIEGEAPLADLALSRDGSQLLLAAGQVRLVRVADEAELARDEECAATALSASGAADRYAAGCQDGSVRLYDNGLKLLHSAPQGDESAPPSSLRFSPDGAWLSVGRHGGGRIEVYNAGDLTQKTMVGDAGAGAPLPMAWSGQSLYAVGRFDGALRLRRFSNAGRGAAQDIPLPEVPVGLAGSPDALFYATTQALGLLDAAGKQVYAQKPAVLDFAAGSLKVDVTSNRVSVTTRDGAALTFVVSEHQLLHGAADGRLRPPNTRLPVEVRGWQGGAEVTHGDARLPLDEGETSRALAALPGNEGFMLATDRALRAYQLDKEAPRLRYAVPLPAGARALNVSADGRLAVVALADGTLRWHAVEDGKALLSLFVHADRRRWIAWTPSGRYAAALGGEDLLAWHVERPSPHPSDSFRIGLFHDALYRPDLISRVLVSLDEDRALREADSDAGRLSKRLDIRALLPPVVTILDPPEGSPVRTGKITLRLRVRSPSGAPIARLRSMLRGKTNYRSASLGSVVPARRSGRVAQASRPEEEEEHTQTVELPSEDCTVVVVAETAEAASEPALLRLRWEGPRSAQSELRPDLRVLAVGVSEYRDPRLRLDYPAKDAGDLAAALQRQNGALYRSIEVRVLTDRAATRAGLLDGLTWLRQMTTPSDVAVVFMAGHGINDPQTGRFAFLPTEADLRAGDRTLLSSNELREAMSRIPGRVILFLDTCHSGSVMGPQSLRSATDLTLLTNALASVQSGVVVYTASTAGQVSRESPRWGNGAFTKALVEGLRGRADPDQSGRITTSTLEHYLSQRVSELTGGAQVPTTAKPSTMPDFDIARVRVAYPVQKKWWFWAATGLVVAGAVAGAISGTVVQTRANEAMPLDRHIEF